MVAHQYTAELRHAFSDAVDELKSTRISCFTTTALWSDIHTIGTGKLIRPRLFLTMLEHGGIHPAKEHFRIAAGIEMIHQFACIHDDIVDKCNERRGVASLSGRLEREYPGSGTSMALIAADALYSHGFNLICAAPCIQKKPAVIPRLLEYATFTSIGQYEELAGISINQQTIRDLYILKTACYTFAAPLLLAAELTGADSDKLKYLEKVSITAGLAYQLLNDLKDIDCDNDTIGECFNDFRMRKKNAVYCMLENALSTHDQEILLGCWKNSDVKMYDLLLKKYEIRLLLTKEIDQLLGSLPGWLQEFFR